jgi:hypothetical protein
MLIQNEAAKIKEKLENGLLYGERVDMTDPDEVMVAAYYAGWYSGMGRLWDPFEPTFQEARD